MNIQIPAFENINMLIVGDVMLDRYWYGDASRISPEAPVPVVRVNDVQELPGGAGNVALNTHALGCDTTVMGMVGKDAAGEKLQEILEQAGISAKLQKLTYAPTITKSRVISHQQQLLRLDFEEKPRTFSPEKLIKDYQSALKKASIVVLSDYNKGTLAEASTLITMAKAAGVAVFVDPKAKSFSAYRGATVLTPNTKEFVEMVGEFETDEELNQLGQAQMQEYDIAAILITRSEKGMTLLQRGQAPINTPTKAREVFDVTGAGDTVIATLAAAFAAGQDLPHAMALANLAAGIVVAKLGATTATVPELRRALHDDNLSGQGVVSSTQLKLLREDAKAHGEKVVMTNGCFDLIHAGHITYLEQAKALGDKLIVAVNDDASVQKLKGDTRPIMPLAQRMTVLASLKPVDYVVAFSEDTPERLINDVLPDVLVKGGDYKAEDIAGGKAVLKNGGEVKVLGFEEGCSTSNIISKIKGESGLS
tara:strand:+ start:17975 stop:19411 length:1437 start_codon:yes stop_codon:yes gene_type:complete